MSGATVAVLFVDTFVLLAAGALFGPNVITATIVAAVALATVLVGSRRGPV